MSVLLYIRDCSFIGPRLGWRLPNWAPSCHSSYSFGLGLWGIFGNISIDQNAGCWIFFTILEYSYMILYLCNKKYVENLNMHAPELEHLELWITGVRRGVWMVDSHDSRVSRIREIEEYLF